MPPSCATFTCHRLHRKANTGMHCPMCAACACMCRVVLPSCLHSWKGYATLLTAFSSHSFHYEARHFSPCRTYFRTPIHGTLQWACLPTKYTSTVVWTGMALVHPSVFPFAAAAADVVAVAFICLASATHCMHLNVL